MQPGNSIQCWVDAAGQLNSMLCVFKDSWRQWKSEFEKGQSATYQRYTRITPIPSPLSPLPPFAQSMQVPA